MDPAPPPASSGGATFGAAADATWNGCGYELRRNWSLPITCLVLLASSIVGIQHGWFPYHAAFVAWMTSWTSLLVVIRNAFRRSRKLAIRANADVLRLESVGRGKAREIPSAEIAEVKTTPHPGKKGDVDVDLTLRGGQKVTLWLDESTRQHVLRALGIAGGERRASFRVATGFVKRYSGSFALGFVFLSVLARLSPHMHWAEAFVVGFIYALFLAIPLALLGGLVRGKVVIGGDGFTTRWLRRRFVPFSDVESIDQDTAKVVVTLRNGRKIVVRPISEPETAADAGAEEKELVEHLQNAFGRFAKVAAAAEVSAMLRHGERSAHDWLAGLDTLVRAGGGGYRVAAITPELLAEVARAPEGATDARVGAAAALLRVASHDHEKHRVAVRVAAEACAEPRARVALEELAEARDDVAVEAALRRLTVR